MKAMARRLLCEKPSLREIQQQEKIILTDRTTKFTFAKSC